MDVRMLGKIGLAAAGLLNLLNFGADNYMTNVVICAFAIVSAIIL